MKSPDHKETLEDSGAIIFQVAGLPSDTHVSALAESPQKGDIMAFAGSA